MSYHGRLHEQSRRANDRAPDDGLGLLAYGLSMIAIIAVVVVWVMA